MRQLKERPKRAPSPKPISPVEGPRSGSRKSTALGNIDLDEGPDAAPITEQIAMALRKNAGKVMDLFREWDADGDGEVTLKEFRKAMPALGLEVPVTEVDKLFNQWDKSGDGSLGYKELRKILAQGASHATAAAASVKSTGKKVMAASMLAAKLVPAAAPKPVRVPKA